MNIFFALTDPLGGVCNVSKIRLQAAGNQSYHIIKNNICSKSRTTKQILPYFTFIQNDKRAKRMALKMQASRGSVASDTGRQTAANTLQILLAT